MHLPIGSNKRAPAMKYGFAEGDLRDLASRRSSNRRRQNLRHHSERHRRLAAPHQQQPATPHTTERRRPAITPGSVAQSRVHRICVPGSISTHMLTSQV
jgi:hypothetical protein